MADVLYSESDFLDEGQEVFTDEDFAPDPPGLLETIGSRIALTLPEIKRQAGGLVSLYEDENPDIGALKRKAELLPFPFGPVARMVNPLLPSGIGTETDYGGGMTREAEETSARVREQYPTSDTFGGKVIDSIPGFLPAIGTSLVAPAAAPFIFGASSLGDEYSRRRQEFPTEEAAAMSVGPAAVDAVVGKFLPKSLSQGGKGVTGVAKSIISPLALVTASGTAQEAARIGGESFIGGKDVPTEEASNRLLDAGESSLAAGALFSGAGLAARPFSKKTNTSLVEEMEVKADAIVSEQLALPAPLETPRLPAPDAIKLLPPPQEAFTAGENPGKVVGEVYTPAKPAPIDIQKAPSYKPPIEIKSFPKRDDLGLVKSKPVAQKSKGIEIAGYKTKTEEQQARHNELIRETQQIVEDRSSVNPLPKLVKPAPKILPPEGNFKIKAREKVVLSEQGTPKFIPQAIKPGDFIFSENQAKIAPAARSKFGDFAESISGELERFSILGDKGKFRVYRDNQPIGPELQSRKAAAQKLQQLSSLAANRYLEIQDASRRADTQAQEAGDLSAKVEQKAAERQLIQGIRERSATAQGIREAHQQLAMEFMGKPSPEARVQAQEIVAEGENLSKALNEQTQEQLGIRSAISKVFDDMLAYNKKMWADETGGISIGVTEIQKAIDNLKFAEGGKKTKLDPSQDFFEGAMGPLRNRVIAGYRKGIIFPKTLAEKFSNFKYVYENTLHKFEDSHSVTGSLTKELRPYFDLSNKSKVNAVLEVARKKGSAFIFNERNLARLGLDDTEVQAAMSVRRGMDYSLEVLREALKQSKRFEPLEKVTKWNNAVDTFIDDIRTKNYVPFGRFGDRYVHVRDASGNTVSFSLHESRKSQVQEHNQWLKQGMKVEYGRIPAGKAMGDFLPGNLKMGLASLDPEAFSQLGSKGEILGFMKHLTSARLTPGFEKNFERSIAEYSIHLGKYAAKLKHNPAIERAISQIDPQSQPDLFNYANKYHKWIDSVGGDASAFRQFASFMYLGGNIKSAVVNMTQPVTTTYPVMARYHKNPGAAFARSLNLTKNYFFRPESFKRTQPELYRAIESGLKKGLLDEQMTREMLGHVHGSPIRNIGQRVSDGSMVFFSAAERFNRVNAFIAGWESAPKKASSAEKVKFAEDFTRDTQFDYSKANRPEVARPALGSAAFTFRQFPGNWLRLARNNMDEVGLKRVLPRMLATQAAFGGALGLPGVAILAKGLEAAGFDIKTSIRDFFKEEDEALSDLPLIGEKALSDLIIYGMPAATGVNIAGAVNMFDLSREVDEGVAGTIGKMIGGVPVAMATKFGKGISQAFEPGTMTYDQRIYRTIEDLVPSETTRNLMVAGRAAKEGAFLSKDGRRILENPSWWDIGAKAVGFTPSPLARAYEKEGAERNFQQEVLKVAEGFHNNLARAKINGDDEAFQSLIEEALEHNRTSPPELQIKLSKAAIKDAILKQTDSDLWKLKRTKKIARPALKDIQDIYEEDEGDE